MRVCRLGGDVSSERLKQDGKDGMKGRGRTEAGPLLQTLLGGRGRAVGLRQRHDAVRALEVRLEGLLIGGLQRLEQMLRLPAVVTMETPIAPTGEHKRCVLSQHNILEITPLALKYFHLT